MMWISKRKNKYMNKYYTDHVLPNDIWDWLLLLFIISSLTISFVPGLSIITIMYGSIFSGIFLLYFLYNRISLTMPPEIIIYFLWIMWSLGGLSNVINETWYYSQLKTVLQMGVMIFIIGTMIAMKSNISIVMFGIVIGSSMVILNSIYMGEVTQFSSIGARVRLESITGNANKFAYCVLFLAFSLLYFWNKKSSLKWRVILSTAVFISLMFIVFSGSRKTLIAFLIFILFWFIFCQRNKLTRNPIIAYLTLVVLLGGIYFVADHVKSEVYMSRRFESEEIERGGSHRIRLYVEGIQMIKSYPIFGVGLGNYKAHSSTRQYSHSDYIEVAAGTGIVGFMLYFSIYLMLWLRLNRIKCMTTDSQLLYIVGFMKAAVIAMLLVSFGSAKINSKITWIFLASAIGYSWKLERSLKMMSKKYRPTINKVRKGILH